MRWWMVFAVAAGCDERRLRPPVSGGGDARVDGLGVVLNEILADPAPGGDPGCDGLASVTADEMIELVNVSAVDVDLTGGTVSDGWGLRHVFPDGTVVAPGSALVVFGGGSPQPCPGASALVQTASTGALGLNNTGDRVLVVAPDGEVLADVTFGSESDQSLVRSPELSDGVFVPHTSVSSAPWSPGTAVDGSPFGTAPPPPPAEVCVGFEATAGLSGEDLVETLRSLTANTCNDYGGATDFLFGELDGADGDVECVYTGRVTAVSGGRPDNDDMNTEHSWPQSLGASTNPERCDLHHLYPTDSRTNGLRGNSPFGEVVTDTRAVDGGSRSGRDAGGVLVFEPRDAHKGNVARSMAWFAMRYDRSLSDAEVALYATWSASDPPDAAEVARTQAIAERQGSPNPYVLCPELLERL